MAKAPREQAFELAAQIKEEYGIPYTQHDLKSVKEGMGWTWAEMTAYLETQLQRFQDYHDGYEAGPLYEFDDDIMPDYMGYYHG